MNLLGLIAAERSRRAEPNGWQRVVIENEDDEAKLASAIAEGHIRRPIIIRRIVAPSLPRLASE